MDGETINAFVRAFFHVEPNDTGYTPRRPAVVFRVSRLGVGVAEAAGADRRSSDDQGLGCH